MSGILIGISLASTALNVVGAFFLVRLIKKSAAWRASNREYANQIELLETRILDLGGIIDVSVRVDSDGNFRRD